MPKGIGKDVCLDELNKPETRANYPTSTVVSSNLGTRRAQSYMDAVSMAIVIPNLTRGCAFRRQICGIGMTNIIRSVVTLGTADSRKNSVTSIQCTRTMDVQTSETGWHCITVTTVQTMHCTATTIPTVIVM
jgi:hypothetical protein